jgi:hypothetical protein
MQIRARLMPSLGEDIGVGVPLLLPLGEVPAMNAVKLPALSRAKGWDEGPRHDAH